MRGYAYRQRRKQILNDAVCVYCGNVATQVDHVIPVAFGGGDESSNLVPCCSICNNRKGAKLKWNRTYINKRWIT